MGWCTFHNRWALLRMAASEHIQGYSCEYLDSVSDDFCCKRCSLVARKLSITSCCGETYCHACIADTQQQGKPCPACGENEFSITQHIKLQKKVKEFLVYCSLKERGCGWSGPLKELDSHLDLDQDNCQYVDTKCPLNCQQAIPKNKVEQHVAQECAKRKYVCQYCNFSATYEEVVSVHFPECKYVPLQCPNLCGVTFERDFMEDHMKMCRLEEVGCEFDGVGCEERLTREEQEEHTRQNSQTHLILTASLAAKMNKNLLDWSAEDKEEKQLLKKKVEEQQKMLKLQEQKIKDQELTLGEQKLLLGGLEQSMQQLRSLIQHKDKKQEAECRRLEQKLIREQQLTLLYHSHGLTNAKMRYFLMANFSKEKAKDKISDWWSPAMYTHDGGYKFCIGVDANGYGGGRGKAIRVMWKHVVGEYDDQLKWPTTARLPLELFNQDGGVNLAHTSRFPLNKPDIVYVFSRISVDGDRHFVKHSELDHFLVNDTLIFHISNITII